MRVASRERFAPLKDEAMARSEKPAFAANIDAAVAPFLNILRDKGRERERLALEVGSDVRHR